MQTRSFGNILSVIMMIMEDLFVLSILMESAFVWSQHWKITVFISTWRTKHSWFQYRAHIRSILNFPPLMCHCKRQKNSCIICLFVRCRVATYHKSLTLYRIGFHWQSFQFILQIWTRKWRLLLNPWLFIDVQTVYIEKFLLFCRLYDRNLFRWPI